MTRPTPTWHGPSDGAEVLLEREIKRLEAVECSHQDLESGHCIDCGKDLSEEIASRAYDRAKDFRKYGEW